MAKQLTIDSDGHILEPVDLWERYLEPEFRARAIRIGVDRRGYEYLEIAGRKSPLHRGVLGALGGAYQDPRELLTPGKVTYWQSAQRTPGAIDPRDRLKEMDRDGIDVAILYPTIGILWEGECQDAELAAAYCRAYNNYLFDFCSVDSQRLIAAAHVNLRDVTLAVAEVERVKGRAKGIFVTPYPGNGKSPGDPYYDPFWAACEAAGLPVATHVQVRPDFLGAGLQRQAAHPTRPEEIGAWFIFMQLPEDSMLALNCMFQGSVLTRFPRLKYVVLETGVGWLPGWMDRADEKYELFGFTTQMPRKPSRIFREHCWISSDVDDGGLAGVARDLGADRMMWATDYPHIDAPRDPLAELHKNIGALSDQQREWILGKTAASLYNL